MSTQIQNTLFRFVSLRNPELPDLSNDKEKSRKFIFRETAPSHFDDIVNGRPESQTKWEALQEAAMSFPEDRKYVKVHSESTELTINNDIEFLDFSIWLIKNRTTVKIQDVIDKSSDILPLDDETVLTRLWDNLFYQVVTQESFALKEAIMQVLLANHVIKNLDKMSDLDNSLLFSTVVLPKNLFNENENSSILTTRQAANKNTSNTSLKPGRTSDNINIEKAKANIKNLLQLKDELKIVEKRYEREYKKAYDEAYQGYLDKNQPIIDAYNQQYEAELKDWCANRDKAIDENDPCYNKPIYNLPIEKFEFSYSPILDDTRLSENLTEKSYVYLKYILEIDASTGNSIPLEFDDYGNIAEVNEIIDSQIRENQKIISSKTEIPTIQLIGGIPFSKSSNNRALPHNNCYALTFITQNSPEDSDGDWDWEIYIRVDANQPVNIVSIQTPLSGSSNNYFYTIAREDTYHTIQIIPNAKPSPNPYQNDFEYEHPLGPTMTGNVTLANGKVLSFDSIELQPDAEYVIYYDCEDQTDIDFPPAFKPSGFGFRQLGIADYRKVDQSTFCYVEGEVAHIENIMAREYKEKSTRRLRITEDSTTTSSETELEQLTDTTSTSRFEMQTEVAKVLQQSRDFNINTEFHGSFKLLKAETGYSIGAGFASHVSKEESIRQAQTQAQEITNRALDRIVSRVREERVYKVIEEFEENNRHGFDNRKGDKHVVGVYRWVDKIYKNQIYNYGKRLMFEFMVPQPGKLHHLGMELDTESTSTEPQIQVPVDPRAASGELIGQKISNPGNLDEGKALFWAGYYNVEIESKPENIISVGESFNIIGHPNGGILDRTESNSGNGKITIPEGYKATYAKGKFSASGDNDGGGGNLLSLKIGDQLNTYESKFWQKTIELTGNIDNYTKEVPVSFTLGNHVSGDITATVECVLTEETLNNWKIKTFNAIISAYEEAKATYEEKMAEGKEVAKTIKDDNPLFYRDIENIVLRKNCISYLVDRDNDYGKKLYNQEITDLDDIKFDNFEIDLDANLDNYTAKAKFMEQAFEWNIMSYYLYPYYWGNKGEWRTMYQYDNIDPLFKNFMSAGMARVVVTVRPGFEDAVRHFMATGQIWNGGQVPVIEDDLYLSIVDEMKEEPGKKEGKAWLNRVPTSLTVLQAGSLGLEVKKALPCNCEELNDEDFINPEILDCNNRNFEQNNNLMTSESDDDGNADSNTDTLFNGQPPYTAIYNEVDNDDNDNEFKFKVLNQAGETIILGTKKYVTEELAIQALNYCLQQIIHNHEVVIEHVTATDQRWHYRIFDIQRTQLARSINKYETKEDSIASANFLIEWADKITSA